MSIKVFKALQLVETAMIQIQLSNYALSNVRLNRFKSYFKFILMFARYINLNPGAINTIKITCGMTSLFATLIFLLTELNINLRLAVITQIVLISGNAFIHLNKDILIDRIEHAYLFYCSNLVVNSCFLIWNPQKYHIGFKRDRAV